MSQISEIVKAQQNLEELVMRKMEELQAQLQCGTAKDTVAKVSEEFRTFRELTFSMLSLLRTQIAECSRAIDIIETRSRRKYLLISGVQEQSGENCVSVLLNIVHHKMSLKDVTANSIKVCHRLGNISNTDNQRSRPLLVKFATTDIKTAIWRAKSKLKGTPYTLKEFLTKARQSVFAKARIHFGVRSCWTQDGIIVVKSPDGKRHKLTSLDELQPLSLKYPKASSISDSSEEKKQNNTYDNLPEIIISVVLFLFIKYISFLVS